MCPFGMLHWKHTLATGFRLTGRKATIARTPSLNYKVSTVTRIADLTVDPTGGVKGAIRFVLQGQEAVYWRQIALENDEDEVKKLFNEWMRGYLPDGVEADFDHFLGLDTYDTTLLGFVQVTGNLGSATGKHFFLPGLFFESNGKHPFVAQDKRAIPVDVHYAKTEQDDVTYHLPSGYGDESAPQPNIVTWADHAKLTITTLASGNDVHVVRNLVYNYTILDPKEYGALHDFYQKVAAADQQQLILTRSAKAASN
jgi:hypothetical protein